MHNHASHARPRQRDRLLALLKACAPDWVSLAEILAVAGAQYGARIYELRRLGHRIQNRPGGGWFRLLTRPVSTSATVPESPAVALTPSADDRLFPDDTPRRHLDLG